MEIPKISLIFQDFGFKNFKLEHRLKILYSWEKPSLSTDITSFSSIVQDFQLGIPSFSTRYSKIFNVGHIWRHLAREYRFIDLYSEFLVDNPRFSTRYSEFLVDNPRFSTWYSKIFDLLHIWRDNPGLSTDIPSFLSIIQDFQLDIPGFSTCYSKIFHLSHIWQENSEGLSTDIPSFSSIIRDFQLDIPKSLIYCTFGESKKSSIIGWKPLQNLCKNLGISNQTHFHNLGISTENLGRLAINQVYQSKILDYQSKILEYQTHFDNLGISNENLGISAINQVFQLKIDNLGIPTIFW